MHSPSYSLCSLGDNLGLEWFRDSLKINIIDSLGILKTLEKSLSGVLLLGRDRRSLADLNQFQTKLIMNKF